MSAILRLRLDLPVSSAASVVWTVAHQAPQSTGFCRQEYWSGLPFPSPGDLLYPGMEPPSLALTLVL